ncbi:MAG: hypothetical protein UW68_C0005G0019 [Candidatus Collierbacteria bacterium GW2011_GWB1_44_6]|uniref:Uncharacterized protein n=1 Tax=Candidatus Collierbacteria bacterium GW2011_GWB1_44_6 TaxID=1618384 RepID=A0A0G1JQ44_9BACT|nr:MAG: hypothetical protein UW68_C0005G0019 [Candidatus Collierbacteria bacterium GW2011_GWB1_44_6]
MSIKMKLFSPDTQWIKQKISETGCPIFSIFLPGHEVVSELIILNKGNGMELDLVKYLSDEIDLIRYNEDNPDLYEDFIRETGVEGSEESRIWMNHFLNQDTSMPKARSIQIGRIPTISSLVSALHEMNHVKLEHVINHDISCFEGVMQIFFDENEASNQAMEDFVEIVSLLGLESDCLHRAKRTLDAFFYTYIVSYESIFGEGRFDKVRVLDLTEEDKKVIREMVDWISKKYT